MAIVNMRGGLVGLIPRDFIISLLEKQMWYEKNKTIDSSDISEEYGVSQ